SSGSVQMNESLQLFNKQLQRTNELSRPHTQRYATMKIRDATHGDIDLCKNMDTFHSQLAQMREEVSNKRIHTRSKPQGLLRQLLIADVERGNLCHVRKINQDMKRKN